MLTIFNTHTHTHTNTHTHTHTHTLTSHGSVWLPYAMSCLIYDEVVSQLFKSASLE